MEVTTGSSTMVLTVLTILTALAYLLLRSPDPDWFMAGGLFGLATSAALGIYFVRDALRSRPVTNNWAALGILALCLALSELLLAIPYDMLRVIFSPWPAAFAPLVLALWIGYRNDPLKGIF